MMYYHDYLINLDSLYSPMAYDAVLFLLQLCHTLQSTEDFDQAAV